MDLVVGKNTYFGLDEANEIVENMYLDTAEELTVWQSLSDRNKKILIVQQTRLFDNLIWLGRKYDIKQELMFPRLKDGVKVELKDAGKEVILKSLIENYIYNTNNSNDSTSSLKYVANGIKSISIEGSSMSFDSDKSSVYQSTNLIILKKNVKEVLSNYVIV